MRDFARQMREMGRKQADMIRDQARVSAMKRKEEYLGARVPKDLRKKVIAKAGNLGIPVSILIRNILEEAFKDQVSDEAAQIRPTSGESSQQAVKFPNVIGWERITLNREMPCAACSRLIPAGSIATMGLGMSREDHVILCEKCRVYA